MKLLALEYKNSLSRPPRLSHCSRRCVRQRFHQSHEFPGPPRFFIDPETYMDARGFHEHTLEHIRKCRERHVRFRPQWTPAQVPPIRVWHLHRRLPLMHTPSKTAMDACTGVCVISRCLCRRRHLEKRAAQPAHNPAGASKVACWAPNNQAA